VQPFFYRANGRMAGAPRDIIFARKTLMSVIARNMYPLDEMIYTGKINLPRGRGHADSISDMLQALQFLFPMSTNTWTPNAGGDIAFATFADPHIWEEFDFSPSKFKLRPSTRSRRAAPKRKRILRAAPRLPQILCGSHARVRSREPLCGSRSLM
jgi:hypothetical protein